MRNLPTILAGLCAILAAVPALGVCPDDPGECDASAATLLVRKDCTGLQNCFESVAALTGRSSSSCIATLVHDPALPYGVLNTATCTTNGWLWEDRAPSAASPVAIDVGAGTFLPFVCPRGAGGELGHVTVRGSGRELTTFLADGTNDEVAGIDVAGCDELVFSDLRTEGISYGVRWVDQGEATWHRVDMVGNTSGWGDACVLQDTRSTHFIHDGRVSVTGSGAFVAAGYLTDCAETYFFGGEIHVATGGPRPGLGVLIGSFRSVFGGAEPAEFRAFGTQILARPRGISVTAAGPFDAAVGIEAEGGSIVELHDATVRTDIDPDVPTDAYGARLSGGATLRRFGAAIEATTTSGTSYVVVGN